MRPARRRPTFGEVEDPPELRPALGEQETDEQDAVFEADEVEHGPTPTMVDLDEVAPEALVGFPALDSEQASLEFLGEDELREGETDDAIEATEEGLAYEDNLVATTERVDGVTEVVDRLEVQGIG